MNAESLSNFSRKSGSAPNAVHAYKLWLSAIKIDTWVARNKCEEKRKMKILMLSTKFEVQIFRRPHTQRISMQFEYVSVWDKNHKRFAIIAQKRRWCRPSYESQLGRCQCRRMKWSPGSSNDYFKWSRNLHKKSIEIYIRKDYLYKQGRPLIQPRTDPLMLTLLISLNQKYFHLSRVLNSEPSADSAEFQSQALRTFYKRNDYKKCNMLQQQRTKTHATGWSPSIAPCHGSGSQAPGSGDQN